MRSREAQRTAAKRYHERRKEAGLQKTTVWLSTDARAALEELRQLHGNNDAAVEAALLKLLSESPKPETPEE